MRCLKGRDLVWEAMGAPRDLVGSAARRSPDGTTRSVQDSGTWMAVGRVASAAGQPPEEVVELVEGLVGDRDATAVGRGAVVDADGHFQGG